MATTKHYRKQIRSISFVILLLVSFVSVFAQSDYRIFHHYNTNNGLSQNMVDCILKDSRGYMWFGTRNGLNRFDGYEFNVYKNNPLDSNSLINNYVYDLCEDSFGNLWCGTGIGLNKYIFDQNKFEHVKGDESSLLQEDIGVNSVSFDHQGHLWVGTDKGIFVLNPIDNSGKTDDISQLFNLSFFSSMNILDICEGKNNEIWIATETGLHLFDKKLNTQYKFNPESVFSNDIFENSVNCIYYDNSGVLWVGFETTGLAICNLNSNKLTWLNNDPYDPFSLVHNSIRSIDKDAQNKMLIGTLGGLCVYNDETNGFVIYKSDPENPFSLSNDFVNCIYSDKEGYVWIGTDRGGVNKYNIDRKKFESLDFYLGKNNISLSHNTVNSIFSEPNYLWIGTAGGGLNRVNQKTGKLKVYKYDLNNSNSISSDFITSIYQDNQQNLWISCWGGGVNKLSPENQDKGIFEKYFSGTGDVNSLVNGFVSDLTGDSFGNIWIATIGGLDAYNPYTNTFHHIPSPKNAPPLNEVGCLQFDQKGNLWVGTIHGLYLFMANDDGKISFDNPKTQFFKTDRFDINSISGNYIISILLDNNNDLWFGTYGNGFNKLIVENGRYKFKSYSEKDGLNNNIVYGILCDKDNNLWLSTENGLAKFNPENDKFNGYFKSDGLKNNQFYWSSAFKNKDGKLFFGGMEGIDMFYPDSIKDNLKSPNIVFTGLKIYSNPVEVHKIYDGQHVLQRSITSSEEITLSYKSKEFTIEFSALHYDQPDKNKYKFKLENFDKQWNSVDSKRRFATYSNLPGGHYTFKVMASNNDGVWSKTPAEITINIIPPFWQRWWFRILVIVFLIAITLTYIRIRLNTLKKQKIKLEKKVVERTARIEEQKEELQAMTENLLTANTQLEKTNFEIEEQKNKVEKQNEEILQQRDRLIELNKKVEAANKHRLHFFTNISHEFRTPLTLILSPLEQLVERTDIKFDVRQKVQLMYKNARRLLNLINQLMELRKVETGKLELRATQDDISMFVANISQSFHALSFKRNLNLEITQQKNSIVTYFDHEKIENIVYNLLSNAFKYTPEGGEVSVDIGLSDIDKYKKSDYIPIVDKTSYKNKNNDKFIEIRVSDTGIGVDITKIKEIFKMFYREPSIEGTHVHGTGIGLSLVKELVKTHRGLLYVKSEVDKGSSFTLLLPLGEKYLLPEEIIKENSIKAKTSENLNAENLRKKSKLNVEVSDVTSLHLPLILVVEDNVDLRGYLCEQLQNSFRFIEAGNGKEGIEQAKLYSPDLIVSDIMMPEVNGLEMCSELKSGIETSHIPIILLTSKSGVQDHIDGYDTGADDYIPKPFNINVLESRINNILLNRENIKKLFTERVLPEPRKVTSNALDEKFIKAAINVVNENFQNSDFTVEKFASKMNMSRSLLHKKLVGIVGNSPIDFITTIRMKKAISLLLNSPININEVAYKIGFNDPKYFSRCFKKQYGKTPTEFLKEH